MKVIAFPGSVTISEDYMPAYNYMQVVANLCRFVQKEAHSHSQARLARWRRYRSQPFQ